MPLSSNESPIMSHHNPASPPDRLARNGPSPGLNGLHSREPSVTLARGRPADTSTRGLSTLQAQSRSPGQSHSKSPEPNAGRQEGTIERKPSLSTYGHHRKTSIVHGIQHLRNKSYTSSTSPLSPELIASAGLGSTNALSSNSDLSLASRVEQPELSSAHSGNGNGGLGHGLSTIQDDDLGRPVKEKSTTPQTTSSSGEGRRGRSQSRSISKPEIKTVGEYALHHLFNSFVAHADTKINQSIIRVAEVEAPVEEICGQGADPVFDQCISALGHIARQKPKPLIDTIMLWRKKKGEAAVTAKQKKTTVPENGTIVRRNTEPIHVGNVEAESNSENLQPKPTLIQTQEDIQLAERQATVSVYLVCRVLIEIFNQSSLAAIGNDITERLEDIVFGQLKTVDPEQIAASPLRMANWRIYGQLLGKMSETNFTRVTARYFVELERYEKDAIARGQSREFDAKVELLILGMRHFSIKTYPAEAWTSTCDFMRSLARLFVNSHGQRVKQAYCYIIEKVLLAVAANPACDLAHSRWKEFLELITPRLSQMLAKPRHWMTVFPIYSVLLCVSSKDAFAGQWMSLAMSLPARLKDRPTRGLALQALCRLLWTYLFRYPDPPNVTLRRVDEVIKVALPPGKRTYLTTEPAVVEPLIQLVRMTGFKLPDLCFRNIIFPLINSDLFMSGRELKIEQMEPEKMVLGIRSFLAIMTDLENGDQLYPPFPAGPISTHFVDIPNFILPPRPQLLADPKSISLPANGLTLSRPVNTSKLNDLARGYYLRFCEVLGKITLLCDNTFGGQAALDEKFGSSTPKTPISEAFSFARRDDHSTIIDQKQSFYDLLHVAVQTIPRCLSDQIPFNSLINLLCTGTAHVQSNIARSSAESLKSIARQTHAQQVIIGFARFIFNFDARYSTMSDEGMLGPGHIESTLTLYVELLRIWIEEIQQKTKEASSDHSESNTGSGTRALQLDLSSVLAYVEEIEAHGLFFLCSQSRRVRGFAISVLRLVTEFDSALGKESTRIIRILEADSHQIMDLNDEQLTVAERSRLHKGKRRSASQNTLIELCNSEVSYDSTLWVKVFPNIIRVTFDTCPVAVTLAREIVCARLVHMHKTITSLAEMPRHQYYGSLDVMQGRTTLGRASSPAEIMIEQWKLYLVMACTTLNSVGAQSQSQLANAQHARKTSRATQTAQDKIGSARALFAFVIPLLSASLDSIRDAVVAALGSINKSLYRTLLESLQYAVTTCNEEAKLRIGTHTRTPSSPRRSRKTDRLRTEVTHVYKLTSTFLKEPDVFNDDWIVNNLITYAKDLRIFLSDAEVQIDWGFQRLRSHYCGLMEELFEGINRSKEPSRWLSFESRKSAFSLMEDWCGYSPSQKEIAQREENMRRIAIAQQQETGEIRNTAAAMEIEKKNLRVAALSAMASLCAGPISTITEGGSVLQFDVTRILKWIDSIFETMSDKLHAIGQRALKNLIIHNKEYSYLLERTVEKCYMSEPRKTYTSDPHKPLESYFEVVAQVLIEETNYSLAFWRILAAVLYTLGNEKREIRMKSARLLRTLEERQQKSSRLQDFDISISDKTTAVYKLAQFEISKRLASQHGDLAFIIFSEFCLHFRTFSPDGQRNIVTAVLPWIQIMELQIDPNNQLTANSYMLLANLFEITISRSSILPNEVQALWQALATGPHGGNVQVVLDFIIGLCLDRKEQNFVEFAKQIVVFLSSTPAGSKVIEFFLLHVAPKHMVQERKDTVVTPPDNRGLPYVADLDEVLPIGNKQAGLSLGQLSMIFLVDLMVAPVTLALDDVVKLLHVVLILWDHYNLTVQEQAREMLVHLIHELVASKIQDEAASDSRKAIEDFVESIRKSETSMIWEYEDNTGKDEDDEGAKVPTAMALVTREVVNFFSLTFDDIGDSWSKEALSWATSCPVRHLACRSFQIFRCISTSLEPRMLADMLARLSNTIADKETDYQTFSMEILTTLKVIISSLAPGDLMRYPQLFWTTCACLNTIHETEFIESIGMLEKLLDRIDMSDANVVSTLMENQPPLWEGGFSGIQDLVYKGLKSSKSLYGTLSLLHRLIALPDNAIIGGSNRLLFAMLANLPHFLSQFDVEECDPKILDRADLLGKVAERYGLEGLAACLIGLANTQWKKEQDFLQHIVSEIRSHYFPEQEVYSLVFVMGLLTNTTTWFRIKVMSILCALIPEMNMRRSEVTCHGPDLISPLLRLLQTELCPQALKVMDHIMEVSGNPLERQHLRMSMASSSSSRAIRKQYERVQSLYGIPEPTGWSIPIPASQSANTRHNVHAVFYTCAEADRTEAQRVATPEVEFHFDEYNESYFPSMRADTMQSIDTQTDGNMGDIVQKLDSLDDFFDETDGVDSSFVMISGLRGFPGNFVDTPASLYDQQTAPILRKSLARTPSSSSFHNGLAETSRPPTRLDGMLNLGSPPLSQTSAAVPGLGATIRPAMHNRSVTSPANHLAHHKSSLSTTIPTMEATFFSDSELEEGFSDVDERTGGFQGPARSASSTTARKGSETAPSLESMIRSGMRRLTGGTASARDKERQRDLLRAQQRAAVQTANSPRVPKVPAEFLTGSVNSPTSPGQGGA
ncbi:putative cell morphogenesis protein [Talaromyces proteolyticus]|uniref:Cell morphogenesis protein n=1 Tax=Talaromyces proteolyticus TaxID=1131652 RepID=A0AAD4KX36_9EURO|nr:putative cell morphogenesis protein [Talaromyces proteolyticus]KAH8700802.1 putative cell morphogenesis protein [Talaromyces proteolyticus]